MLFVRLRLNNQVIYLFLLFLGRRLVCWIRFALRVNILRIKNRRFTDFVPNDLGVADKLVGVLVFETAQEGHV